MFELKTGAAGQNLILSIKLYQLIKYNFHLEAYTSSCQGGEAYKNNGTIAQNKIEEPSERWVID